MSRRLLLVAGVCCSALSCQSAQRDVTLAVPSAPAEPTASPLQRVLAEHVGDTPLDAKIRALQARVPSSRVVAADLERLGWAFVARARELSDPGAYNMALQCALAIEDSAPGSHSALLLRGHALQSLHHFEPAEAVARQLVRERGLPFDYGLLGDVLTDRGQVQEAVEAYQRMMELRPDVHAYGRAAHVRYLMGDLDGALQAMEMAARAASPRSGESFAWTWSRLSHYQLQQGDVGAALDSAERALSVSPASVHALLAKARALLARDRFAAALEPLQQAVSLAASPESLWMLADALEAHGAPAEAVQVYAQLSRHGAIEDPRGYALFLATRGQDLEVARRLIERELEARQDIYTYQTLGRVQSARGDHEAALQSARRALSLGTVDASLFYHVAMIAWRAGDRVQARAGFERAAALAHMLMPSQRRSLWQKLEAAGQHAFVRTRASDTSMVVSAVNPRQGE